MVHTKKRHTLREFKMKKTLFGGLALLAASTLAAPAMAEGWKAMPVMEDGWDPEFTVALTYGPMNFDEDGVDDENATGAQFSLNCPWFGPPAGAIRQQFNYNSVEVASAVDVTTFELNPRYYMGDGSVTFGFGPGVGYMWADDGTEDNVWTFQVGADVEYRSGAMFVGAGTRYQVTQDFDDGEDANNLLTTVKLGVNF